MGNFNIFLPERENKFVTLKSPTPLQYTILEGKHVVGTICEGSIVKLSETGAELSSKTLVPPLSNIKIVLLSGKDQDESLGDLYAKVMGKPEDSDTNFYIRFTAIPPDVAALISELVAQNTD